MPNDNPFITPDPFPSPKPQDPISREEKTINRPSLSEAKQITPQHDVGATLNDKELWKKFGAEKEAEAEMYINDSPMEDSEVFGAVKKACTVTLIISAVFLIVAFGIWYFSKNNFGSLAEVKSEMITAKDGGKVVFENAKIIVPPGALEQDTKIEIEKVKEGEITDLFYFKPHGLKFLKPVMVVIPYKEDDLKEGQSPHDIKLKYWLGEQEGEESLLNYTVDTEAKTLNAQVTQF